MEGRPPGRPVVTHNDNNKEIRNAVDQPSLTFRTGWRDLNSGGNPPTTKTARK